MSKVNTARCPWGKKIIWRARGEKNNKDEKTQIAIVIIIIITAVLIMRAASIRMKYSFI